jgi:hypothetical protein
MQSVSNHLLWRQMSESGLKGPLDDIQRNGYERLLAKVVFVMGMGGMCGGVVVDVQGEFVHDHLSPLLARGLTVTVQEDSLFRFLPERRVLGFGEECLDWMQVEILLVVRGEPSGGWDVRNHLL